MAGDTASASAPAADLAFALGLEDYQLELLQQLAEQAERQGIPVDALPILAKYVEKIDWDLVLATPTEAAEILGVEERTITRLAESEPAWMTPFMWVRSKSGETVVRLWVAAKVRAFERVRRG